MSEVNRARCRDVIKLGLVIKNQSLTTTSQSELTTLFFVFATILCKYKHFWQSFYVRQVAKFSIFTFYFLPGAVSHHAAVRVIYRTKDAFKNIAKNLGIMDDFKSGVPR